MQITAQLMRYKDLSWKTLSEIKSWFRHAVKRDGFDLVNTHHLLVASANNSVGHPIVHCFVEPVLMVSGWATNPQATEPEIRFGGDAIDNALAHKAQQEGVKKLLIILPDAHKSEPDEVWVRVVTRNIPEVTAMKFGDSVQATHSAQFN